MRPFPTHRKESLRTRVKRIGFNFFPAYRRTGGRLTFLSDDFREVHVMLRLKWTTRNYVGTVFGGSIFGALDPIYMVQLINILGKGYIAWNKSAEIKFLKPIRRKVFARFLLDDALIESIKRAVEEDGKHQLELEAHFQNKEGTKYATVVQQLYITNRASIKNKKAGNR